MDKDIVYDTICEKKNWFPGRMISGSKSGYRNMYPDHEVYFNANIFVDEGKIWYGDIDVNIDKEYLQEVANKTNTTLYILSEHDGRFENENLTLKEIKAKARLTIFPNYKQ